MPDVVDAGLEPWEAVAADGSWPALLIGNGASIAVWPKFEYDSLFLEAHLDATDVELFDALGDTRNFELVLDALRVTRMVCRQMGHDDEAVEQRYERIRERLITAVNDTHVPWAALPEETLVALGTHLLTYDRVYSTNYDLLVYWSLNHVAGKWEVGDYFWNTPDLAFDVHNTEPRWEFNTMVHYLHGGLHLSRTPDGRALKRLATTGSLLDLLGAEQHGADIPLFVSEGTSADKMRVIRSSDYLSFVHRAFSSDDAPMVVFGNGLGAQDAHLAAAIGAHSDRRVAVALRPDEPLKVVAKKTALLMALPAVEIRFFDATTHPLGDPALQSQP